MFHSSHPRSHSTLRLVSGKCPIWYAVMLREKLGNREIVRRLRPVPCAIGPVATSAKKQSSTQTEFPSSAPVCPDRSGRSWGCLGVRGPEQRDCPSVPGSSCD